MNKKIFFNELCFKHNLFDKYENSFNQNLNRRHKKRMSFLNNNGRKKKLIFFQCKNFDFFKNFCLNKFYHEHF